MKTCFGAAHAVGPPGPRLRGSRFRASAECKIVAFLRTTRWVKVNKRLRLELETDHLGLKTACTTINSEDLHYIHDKTASGHRAHFYLWPISIAPGYNLLTRQALFTNRGVYHSHDVQDSIAVD